MGTLYRAYGRGSPNICLLLKLLVEMYKVTRATSTCLKLNYLKIIGLHPTVLKKSNLLLDRITNYICYLKI